MPRKRYAEFSPERKQRVIAQTIESRKRTTKGMSLTFSLNTDADIIARLESVPNKAGYLKDLIRADIAKNGIENK